MREVSVAVAWGSAQHELYAASYEMFPIELVGLVASVTYAYDDYRAVDARLTRVLGVEAHLYERAARTHDAMVTLVGTYSNAGDPVSQATGVPLDGLSPLVASVEVWLSVPVPGIAQLLVVVLPNERGRLLGRDVLLAHDYDVVLPRWNGELYTQSVREQKQRRLARSLEVMAHLPMFPGVSGGAVWGCGGGIQ